MQGGLKNTTLLISSPRQQKVLALIEADGKGSSVWEWEFWEGAQHLLQELFQDNKYYRDFTLTDVYLTFIINLSRLPAR